MFPLIGPRGGQKMLPRLYHPHRGTSWTFWPRCLAVILLYLSSKQTPFVHGETENLTQTQEILCTLRKSWEVCFAIGQLDGSFRLEQKSAFND